MTNPISLSIYKIGSRRYTDRDGMKRGGLHVSSPEEADDKIKYDFLM